MKTNAMKQTTAQRLLSLVFEGHSIRTFVDGPVRTYSRNDVAAACGIVHLQKSIANHLDPDELGLTKVSVRSANGTLQTREVATITESGVLALVCSSRKPAARRFRRWLTSVVIPQLIELGTFIEGITPVERLAALNLRYKQEKAAQIESDTAWLAIAGHLTIHDFGIEYDIPLSDKLAFAGAVQALATRRAIRPEKRYLRRQPKSPANAWPRLLLIEAMHAFYYPHCARHLDPDEGCPVKMDTLGARPIQTKSQPQTNQP